ncbi:hypothetical protein ASF40_17115 [Microbacterium sp. Leaf288]|uniref:hypothetical protein n=1 Tax=Microbacterium sp. Leaf288 TaxID=1736323 RepID=UPI0006F79EBB|nr:hypothetical protein [Microbacterium sp. Leaf288]KQP69579.1 hypothetical protein ASF40_17115 [Microbacterium sp. Leaf288]
MTDTLARALESDNNGLDRRKLLKIGVWAAPVVVLATAAPAAASSPSTTPVQSLDVTASDVHYTNDGAKFTGAAGSIAIQLVQSDGPATNATGVTVTLTINSASLQNAAPTNLSAGWTSAAPIASGANYVYTFSYPTGLTPDAQRTLDFTLPGLTEFSATIGRSWRAVTSATVTGGTVASTTVQGVVAAQVATATSNAVISGAPDVPPGAGAGGKEVTVTVATASNAAITARMTVKRTHSQDKFLAKQNWSPSSVTIANVVYLITTSDTLPSSTSSVTFPTFHEQNTSDVHDFTIEFLFNGVVYAPATRRGSF